MFNLQSALQRRSPEGSKEEGEIGSVAQTAVCPVWGGPGVRGGLGRCHHDPGGEEEHLKAVAISMGRKG